VYFPAPAAPRDSRLRLSDLREIVLAMLSRTLTALVPFTTHGPTRRVDRTPGRSMLAFNALVARLAALGSQMSRQPVPVWTITRECRTPKNRGAGQHSMSATADHHNYQNRSEPGAESPPGLSEAAYDETRNTYQRNAARDARRHPRGRSARLAAG